MATVRTKDNAECNRKEVATEAARTRAGLHPGALHCRCDLTRALDRCVNVCAQTLPLNVL